MSLNLEKMNCVEKATEHAEKHAEMALEHVEEHVSFESRGSNALTNLPEVMQPA